MNRTDAVTACMAGALFLIVAIPSIKMTVVNTTLLNVLPALLVGMAAFLRTTDPLKKTFLLPLGPWLLFIAILSLSFFFNPHVFPGITELGRYLILFILIIGIPVYATDRSISVALKGIFAWCLFIAVYQLFWGVPRGESFHYLTVGLPIGVLILLSFSRLFYGKSFLGKMLCGGLIVLGYLSLFTLFGRSPILFSLLLIFLFLLFKALFEETVKRKVAYTSFLMACGAGAVWAYVQYVPQVLKDRFSSVVENVEGEARIDAVYMPAMEAIAQQPFLGYGLSSSWELIGRYPHNIFLEILLDAGVLGLLSFLAVVVLFALACLYIARNYRDWSANYLGLLFLTLYHFLFWNVSHDLPSAYGLLPLMALVTLRGFEKKVEHA